MTNDPRQLVNDLLLAELNGHIQLDHNFRAFPFEQQVAIATRELPKLAKRRITNRDALRHVYPNRQSRRRKRIGRCRVGFVAPCAYFPGGAEEWIISLAPRLELERWAICSGVSVIHPSIHSVFVERFSAIAPILIGKESMQLLADQSDCLLIWGIDDLAKYMPWKSCKTILTLHGTNTWTAKFAELSGPLCDAVAGVSELTRPLYPSMTVIPNGVDLARCQPREDERGKMRAAWGLKPGEKTLAYFGRIVSDKDPLAIARAVKELGAGWRAVFVGSDQQGLVAKAEAMIPGRVIHVPPVLRVGEILGSLDCVMIVSGHEGFCLALVECWAAGVPTIATEVGGVPEAEAKFGQLTIRVPFSAEGRTLARAARQATQAGHAAVVERARKAAEEYYNADRMASDWLRLIKTVVRG